MANTRSGRGPRHLFEAWAQIAGRIGASRRLALFTDFDGTLAPIQRHPGNVRLSAGMRRQLVDVASRGHLVAIVSGRAMADLRDRVALNNIWYVGDHGFEMVSPRGHSALLVSDHRHRTMARIEMLVRARVERLRGIQVEAKPATITVHYRGAPDASRQGALAAVQAILDETPQVQMCHGKKVWELRPAAPMDKRRAVDFILNWAKRHRLARLLPFYLGDDIADEAVFARFRGISIAVGRRHGTVAQFYLRSPAEVQELLRRLAAPMAC